MRENTGGVRILFPMDGDCLNGYDGRVEAGKLVIRVLVAAEPEAELYINEEKAYYNGSCFELELPLSGRRNTLLAQDLRSGEIDRIVVYDFRHAEGKYRISSDDNILFLQDITKNKDVYHSIFDNPYLAVYKEAHDRYGAAVHLNLFYETDACAWFREPREYFNLTMMTDKFREEWEANAHWLHLSFHSRAETPDRPYANTTIRRITEDAELIHREIIRFAGEKTLAKVCTVHWGACNEGGVRALRAKGYRALMGYFTLGADGSPRVAYYYPAQLVAHIGRRDFWMNNREDILHGRIDLVLNEIAPENLIPELEKVWQEPHRRGFLELMIHEQYFYPDYHRYIPAFRQMVLEAARWAKEKGCSGVLMGDLLE